MCHNETVGSVFQQREWRIACGFAINGVEVLRKPTEDEANRITGIDEQFFRRQIATDFGPIDPLSRSLIHPGLGGRTILQMARRLIVPKLAITSAKEILKGVEAAPEIVSLEELP